MPKWEFPISLLERAGVADPAYAAIYNTVLGISGFLWPFLGVWLYREMGIVRALDFSAAVRVIGMAAAAMLLTRRRGSNLASSTERPG